MVEWKYWRRWTFHCAVGELLGIAAAGAIAYGVTLALGEPVTFLSKIIVLVSMMIAGLVEGSLLGYFQWQALKVKFTSMPKRDWIVYTVLVAVLGWFLGMLPSLFFVDLTPTSDGNESAPVFDQPWLFILLSMSSGLVLGAIFGVFQWLVLRKYASGASKWIVANALGWSAALGWIYLFASIPTEESSIYFTLLMGATAGILAGVSVGAITGWFLMRMPVKTLRTNHKVENRHNHR